MGPRAQFPDGAAASEPQDHGQGEGAADFSRQETSLPRTLRETRCSRRVRGPPPPQPSPGRNGRDISGKSGSPRDAHPFARRAGRAIASRVALGREGQSKKSFIITHGFLFAAERLWPGTSLGSESQTSREPECRSPGSQERAESTCPRGTPPQLSVISPLCPGQTLSCDLRGCDISPRTVPCGGTKAVLPPRNTSRTPVGTGHGVRSGPPSKAGAAPWP